MSAIWRTPFWRGLTFVTVTSCARSPRTAGGRRGRVGGAALRQNRGRDSRTIHRSAKFRVSSRIQPKLGSALRAKSALTPSPTGQGHQCAKPKCNVTKTSTSPQLAISKTTTASTCLLTTSPSTSKLLGRAHCKASPDQPASCAAASQTTTPKFSVETNTPTCTTSLPRHLW